MFLSPFINDHCLAPTNIKDVTRENVALIATCCGFWLASERGSGTISTAPVLPVVSFILPFSPVMELVSSWQRLCENGFLQRL